MGSLDRTYDRHINLQLGWPSPSLFPSELLAEAAQETLRNHKIAAQTLVYGPDPGHELVRRGTAEWLTRFYSPEAGNIQPHRLFITPGASAALSMLLTRFTDPSFTQYIWMIEPTYFLACSSFQEAGFHGRLRGVPEDAEGLDIEFLRAGLIEAEGELFRKTPDSPAFERSSKRYRHIIYMVPTFSNPSAKVMSLRRRKEVVQLARQFDALIISDDVYDWLRWPRPNNTHSSKIPEPPPRPVDLDRAIPGGSIAGNAVSNGSFSKIVAPGVRVGWVEGSPFIVNELCKIGPVRSGGCQSPLSSMLVGRMLVSGKLEEHIQSTLIPVYQRRHGAMIRSIEIHLVPLGFKISSIKPTGDDDDGGETADLAGGFFLYLDFPTGSPPAETVATVALERFNLRIAYGGMMCVAGDAGSVQRGKNSFGQGARLCWAWHEEADIDEGIQRLALAFQIAKARSSAAN